MYLHLGGETVIQTNDIVGIFDLDKTSTGKITRDFLSNAEKEMRVTSVTYELPKSFIVCEDKTGTRVYLSQIAAQTLKRRAGFLDSFKTKDIVE